MRRSKLDMESKQEQKNFVELMEVINSSRNFSKKMKLEFNRNRTLTGLKTGNYSSL